jgi:hypothetical protein
MDRAPPLALPPPLAPQNGEQKPRHLFLELIFGSNHIEFRQVNKLWLTLLENFDKLSD